MQKLVLGSLSLFVSSLTAGVTPEVAPVAETAQPSPWFTGPLIPPPGLVTTWGHFCLENYVYVTTNTGTYDNHWQRHSADNFYIVNPQFISFWGLTDWMDVQISPQFFYNNTKNQSAWRFGDLPVGFDFQVIGANQFKWFPALKLTIREIFPTGKYQKLDPEKLKTDLSSAGSFQTNGSLLFYKVYHITGVHFLSTTLFLNYSYLAPVHVRGFNAYGGGFGTAGKAYPGNFFQGIIAFEFSLSQNWALSFDTVYIHTNKNRFKGNPGFSAPGTPASVGGPSSEQISFAPAIEYNFSSSFGIIAGAWVTGWGRNSTEFRSGVINIEYTY